MQQDRVDMFVITNAKFLPPEKLQVVKERLSSMDDSKLSLVTSVELKDPTTLLLISIFLGSLGIDRFMLGDIGLGILKLITFGGCGIWTIIDWFIIQGKTKERNFNAIMMYL
ncbi:MAG: TM2 domain-containing protein [Synergistaceae bacterium]|jgi:TM2 domain-containing membrane protein YozV|nr:TM2 domain-containing protein [Synergistaceae bacterium]